MTGVESVDRSSRTKAMKNRIDKGVAGRNMMAKNNGSRATIRLARNRSSRLCWCYGCLRTWDAVLRGWDCGCGRGCKPWLRW
jgi:hypothetical protein